MFLNLLNEKEGKNFLALSKHAMMANGVIKDCEQQVVSTYKMELGLLDYDIPDVDYDKLVTDFQASTKRVKKAVIIELAGVLYADEEISANEDAWIRKLGSEWGFRDSEVNRMVRWTEDFNDLLNEALDYINK